MGYFVRTVLGTGLFVGSVGLFTLKLMQLLESGTCASGNTPYAITKPCPEGTEMQAILLVASIFAGLAGVGIFAARGRRPGSAREGPLAPWGLLAWGGGFTAVGAVALIHSLTFDAMPPDGELGGAIVGVTFLVMGAPVLLWLAGDLIRGSQDPSPEAGGSAAIPTHAGSDRGRGWISSVRPASPGAAETGAPGSATAGGAAAGETAAAEDASFLDQLERLQRLRESGALTDTEFQLEKSRLMADR